MCWRWELISRELGDDLPFTVIAGQRGLVAPVGAVLVRLTGCLRLSVTGASG
jgi:hypothetical protein